MLEQALTLAEDNRSELEKVLSHYSGDPADSLKLRAARFLIENMPGHFSYRGDEVLKYYEIGEKILLSDLTPPQQRDSILKISKDMFPQLRQRVIPDIRIIKGDYLIKNIENAFDLWENKPWAQHLNFDQFCEYILPYKCFEFQQLDHWRDTLSQQFNDTFSSMPYNDVEYHSPLNAARLMRQEIRNKVSPWGVHLEVGYPFLSAATMYKITYGRCTDYVNLAVATMRSHGIPIIIDSTPQWGRFQSGHEWYTILNDKGENLPSEWDISTDPGGAFFPNERIPKIYRNTYAINPDRIEYHENAVYRHPFSFFEKDVTDEYFVADDLSIPIIRDDLQDKYVYIALFNSSKNNWNIIDYGVQRNGRAEFKKMGRNILYLAFGYDGSELVPISHPFILHPDGEVEYVVADPSSLEDMTIRRKFHKSANVVNMERRLLGGRIQAANNRDFSDAVTLYTIENLEYPDLIPLSATRPYRYWRYLSQNGSYGSIAELHFFQTADSLQLTGTVISSLGANDPDGAGNKAFDGDWLTNFETALPDGSWVGLDLGRALMVDRVRCIPRSDGNGIRVGDEYELCYWDSEGWKSLGKKVADDNYLIYTDVPKGALLWLNNLHRGWDERVFLYNNGKQEWW
jgi:hypothetical protein